jgi:hypothetical protein
MGGAASRLEQEDLIGSKFPDPHQRKALRKYCADDIRQYQKGYPVSFSFNKRQSFSSNKLSFTKQSLLFTPPIN